DPTGTTTSGQLFSDGVADGRGGIEASQDFSGEIIRSPTDSERLEQAIMKIQENVQEMQAIFDAIVFTILAAVQPEFELANLGQVGDALDLARVEEGTMVYKGISGSLKRVVTEDGVKGFGVQAEYSAEELVFDPREHMRRPFRGDMCTSWTTDPLEA